MVQSRDVGALADGVFRRESARLVASLTRVFGPGNIHLVEDVVQEALETALQAWQVQIPDNPAAWLSKVARNRALDVIRHQNTQRKYAEEHESQLGSGWSSSTTIDDSLAEEAADENQLRMMFFVMPSRALGRHTRHSNIEVPVRFRHERIGIGLLRTRGHHKKTPSPWSYEIPRTWSPSASNDATRSIVTFCAQRTLFAV